MASANRKLALRQEMTHDEDNVPAVEKALDAGTWDRCAARTTGCYTPGGEPSGRVAVRSGSTPGRTAARDRASILDRTPVARRPARSIGRSPGSTKGNARDPASTQSSSPTVR